MKRLNKSKIQPCGDVFHANDILDKMKAEWLASGTNVVDLVGSTFLLDLEDGQAVYTFEDGYIICETFEK